MIKNRHYIFTKKKHSPKAIMSTVLGAIAFFFGFLVIYLAYKRGGEAPAAFGVTGFMVAVFAFVGLLLGIWSKTERDVFHFFSYLGILLNTLVLIGVSIVLQAPAGF